MTGPVVVTDISRPDAVVVDALGVHGVATVHEAMGRTGLVGPGIRPIQNGARIADRRSPCCPRRATTS